MKEVITTEMKKAFRSKGFLVAALSGVLLAVIQTIWAYQNIYQVNMKERNHILALRFMVSDLYHAGVDRM